MIDQRCNEVQINAKQARALSWLRQELFRHGAYDQKPPGQSRYEWKQWEISHFKVDLVKRKKTCVELHAVIGGKGDEGTAAEFLARNRWHIFIGVRGGMSAWDSWGRRRTGRDVVYANW